MLHLPHVKPQYAKPVNKICTILDQEWNSIQQICRLLNPERFNGQQVLVHYEPHLSLGFDKGLCCLVAGNGVTSPQYLLSVITVRFSGPDRPEWFPCRFDGHLFDLPSFPWLPFAEAWNPRCYLFHHFLGPMCLVEIRHANISGAPKRCAIWL